MVLPCIRKMRVWGSLNPEVVLRKDRQFVFQHQIAFDVLAKQVHSLKKAPTIEYFEIVQEK